MYHYVLYAKPLKYQNHQKYSYSKIILRSRLDWFIYVRVSTITAIIWTVGHKLRSTPTNGHRFAARYFPWWSPIQVLTAGSALLNFDDRVTEQALVATVDLDRMPVSTCMMQTSVYLICNSARFLRREAKVWYLNSVAITWLASWW